MNRPNFAGMRFDVVVVGGGIMGACIARDAARRGLKVALVERGDFSGATSAASSKLVHGGLRYLQKLEIPLVRESLKERRVWAHIAPHLVHPLPFLMPMTAGAIGERLKLRLGFGLYDALAFDRNRLSDPSKHVPRHASIDGATATALEPVLEGASVTGAVRYHDFQMDSPERLGLECVLDAVGAGATAANYVELTGFLRAGGGAMEGIAARDRLTGTEYEIRARAVLNATGAWAAELLHRTIGGDPGFRIQPSKGIHLVCRPYLRSHALLLMGKSEHLFVIPWRGLTLVGTTDTPFEGPLEDVTPSPADREELIARCNAMLPAAHLGEEDVVFAYAGVRPLVSRGVGGSTYDASRAAEIIDHGHIGGPANLLSVIGGKWTTSRLVAERAVDRLITMLGASVRRCDTAEARLPLAPEEPFPQFEGAMTARLAGVPPDVRALLCRNYGRQAEAVVEAGAREPALLEPLAPGFPHIGAEIIHAVRREMAVTLKDVLFRRTALAPMGGATPPAVRRAAALMAADLDWEPSAADAQIAEVERRLVPPD